MDMLKMIFYGFASYEFSFPVFFLKLLCLLYLKGWKEEICRNVINQRQHGQQVKVFSSMK